MILVEKSGGFVDVAINAINTLTHANAVKAGPTVTGKTTYSSLKLHTPGPGAHPQCYAMISRMILSPYMCKVKVTPGLKPGTEVDEDLDIAGTGYSDTLMANALGMGGTTQAKDSRKSASPTAFADGPLERLKTWYDKLPGLGTGCGAKIVWIPLPASTINWVGNASKRGDVPAFIILAHEFSHADRMMRGVSLVGVVGKKALPKYNATAAGTTYQSMVDCEHIEMVGFQCPEWPCLDAAVVTENQMRAEHHMPARVNY